MQYCIIGLGQTGRSCIDFLQKIDAQIVCAVDTRDIKNENSLSQNFPLMLGSHWYHDPKAEALLSQADKVIVSPGVDLRERGFELLNKQKQAVMGDIELFAQFIQSSAFVGKNPPLLLGVTGSNGKSTVTALLAEMAKQAGYRTAIGGNFGVPVLDLFEIENKKISLPYDVIVLELSSFQLELINSLPLKVGVITNVTPDHLERYDSFEHYKATKEKIYQLSELPIYPESIEKQLFNKADKKIMGAHNDQNINIAFAMGKACGFPESAMKKAIADFPGLPHRCELVNTMNDVLWINDSKATNIEAAEAAILGIAPMLSGKIIWLVGGRAKTPGSDQEAVLNKMLNNVKSVIAFGESKAFWLKHIKHAHSAEQLEQALEIAKHLAQPGDAVLLSPAGSSYDHYQNFAQRGEAFKSWVMQTV